MELNDLPGTTDASSLSGYVAVPVPGDSGENGQRAYDSATDTEYLYADGQWYSRTAGFVAVPIGESPSQVSQLGVKSSYWGNICWGI